MSTLSHQEIYKDSGRAAVELPLGDALGALGALARIRRVATKYLLFFEKSFHTSQGCRASPLCLCLSLQYVYTSALVYS